MNDEEVGRAIAAFESALRMDQSGLPRRFDRLARRHAVNAVVVAALLAIGAVLLTLAVGAASFTLWALAFGALGLSLVVDRTHQRRLRRAR
jgi:hypothetical protein